MGYLHNEITPISPSYSQLLIPCHHAPAFHLSWWCGLGLHKKERAQPTQRAALQSNPLSKSRPMLLAFEAKHNTMTGATMRRVVPG